MTIRLLPSQVADAIAAGEVVERPASVVKELIENSLDAGARRVSVEVRGAGRTLIRVSDDGAGIPPQQLSLAFRRHATSKLSRVEDLEAISSLGFRGEALASIAAVSELEARSNGARIRLKAGEVLEEGVAMPVPGTVIEVRDLFSNTPARLRFLKSPATETAACLKIAQGLAMLYPEVRFEVLVEGRIALRSPGRGGLRATATAVLGEAVSDELLDVEADGVRGLASQPSLSRGSRDGILLGVNRRPVASRALGFAVEECYQGALERGRYPVVVLDLSLPPSEVDVNVHPTKREVRFRADGAVFAALQRALRSALAGSRPYQLRPLPAASPLPALRSPVLHEAPAQLYQAPSQPAAAEGSPMRPLGQVLAGYLVAEGPDGVVLVDQHAAHERVLYNRFLARLRGGAAPSQPLLLPETIELEPAQAAAATDHRDSLRALGFELEDFGPGSVRLLEGPVETPPGRLLEALEQLLSTLAQSSANTWAEQAAASLACHSAVRFGDVLDPAEQRRLLTELESAENSVTCPHGRPTRLVLDWQELKRHFRRNY
ncbi:MAG: DNA mismatch repair endonuclease MutL [Candidatus Nephthysia bennettiae]|uniref:DNA mismatch repair protein MutL n=1 Tax=Candidatus Nephthysia bennettiae TaxID=3127016 RepID=A0A934K1L1_9BACT|nr:DNA mismatch repair endonuclease MutL [Candidatus Dormibacteraeota bacterium]MBJ7611243.1 DNA mismatch repair endonuclease MutL [Candidatus Dormibacteraeota bacterium]PZR89818.1 MAG: DNA mismatch repair endonuclease MutL [Candidatus Dormibacteraeota bacterium]